MKKNEQMKVNELCMEYYKLAAQEVERWHSDFVPFNKLTAVTFATVNFDVLCVDNTIVAIYHIQTGVLVDILRLDHGYSPICAMKIAKFRNIMLRKYGRCEMIRYYPV